MRKKIFNIAIIIITIFILTELLIKKSIIYSSIMYALNLWVNNLIPTLFPFFIISDILINYNITCYIPKFIKNFCKEVFNISDNMLTILILSMISGFPSNARNARTLYDNGKITLDEANHILIFSHFANPIFILSTVGVFFFQNEKMGLILLLAHYLSNFLLGILFRSCNGTYKLLDNEDKIVLDFGNIFISSIRKAIDTILMICGIVVFFSMLSAIIINTVNVNSYNEMIIKSLFEITVGIQALSNLNIAIIYKVTIASCILAFGGISVHMQVFSQIAGTKIKYIYFFVGRMYQMIISGIMTYVICIVLNI